MRHQITTAVVAAGLLLLAACTSDDESEEQPSTVTSTSSSDVDASAQGEAFHTQPGLPVFAAEAGDGDRPLLSWDAVDGAAFYALTVFDLDGERYWGWNGDATSVHVGGEPQLEDLAPGPRVVAGMTWGVGAYDADHVLIATSPLRTFEAP